jgi:hypothetical protein
MTFGYPYVEKTKPIYGHWLEVYGQIVLLGFERAINL